MNLVDALSILKTVLSIVVKVVDVVVESIRKVA